MELSKEFRLKVRSWVTQQQSFIYFSFQAALISAVFLIYPMVETVIVVMLWLNFSGFCYLLYILEVPVVFVTGIALATFRVLMFLFNNTLIFGAIVVLSTVVVFWVVSKAVEKVPFIKGNLDTHSQIEKTTAKHFRELKLIGALVLQVNFCLLLLGYCLFFELSDLYCLVITEWYFFLPCSLILSTSLVFVNCMESIIRVYFNQT
jgi:hypothetical protein